MRVLHVLDHAVLGRTDYARRALALLDGLRAQGVQTVHLAAPGTGPEAPPPGWQCYRTPGSRSQGWPQPLRHALDGMLLARRLRQVAHLTRPDLVHVHAAPAHAFAAVAGARGARLPLLLEADRRVVPGCKPPLLDRIALHRADGLVAGSADVRAALRAAGIRARRIAILPAAADVAGVRLRAPGPPGLEGAPLLACAGRLDDGAGIGLLLAALATLRRHRPGLRLAVAGDGPARQALDERVAALGLRGYVGCTGLLPGRRAADLFPRADVTVFPALPGHGTVVASRHLLNAMAQGCAVVASDLDCHRELIVHGHDGLLFRAGSQAALEEALARLLDAPAHALALGRAAAATAAARHTWPAAAARYRRLYATLIGAWR